MGAVEIGTLRRTAGYDKKRLTGYNPARRYLVCFAVSLHGIVHLLGYKSPLPGTGFFWQVNSCRIMSKLFSLHGGSLLKPPYQNTVQGSSKQKETAALIYSKPPYQLCRFAWEMICLPAVFFFSPLWRQMFEYVGMSYSAKAITYHVSKSI